MKKNLFEVGEVVILSSKYFPELNGEYLVENFYYEHVGECRATGAILPASFVYELKGSTIPWNESALRKKHDGCGQSFQQLLSCLNTNQTEKV